VLAIICGTDIPTETIDSSDSTVYVRFHSNSDVQNIGFQLNFVSSVEGESKEIHKYLETSSCLLAVPIGAAPIISKNSDEALFSYDEQIAFCS
jgi:hypothetical protein